MVCLWGVCLWSWHPGSPLERGGGQEAQGSRSSWEAPVGGPRPHPALPSRAAGSAAAACQCGLIGLFLWGQQSDLDHSACRGSLEPLRRWEVRAGGMAAGKDWGVGRVSVAPGLELPPHFLGSQVRVCLALSPCLRVDGLSVGVPLGPRVPSALVCLALSPCLWVDGLSVCGCPFGSLGPECVCLPGSVSMSPGGWALCLWVSLWVWVCACGSQSVSPSSSSLALSSLTSVLFC